MKERWCHEIDLITSEFKQSFGSLSVEQLNWKPNPNSWSIGQNIDHLIVINNSYQPVIAAIRDKNNKLPFVSKFNFLVNFMGQAVLKAVQPDSKKKTKTFPIWEPSISDITSNIMDRFEKQQLDLKILIKSSLDLLDKGTIISSPANKNIVYKLETAFDIIIVHERRHLEQSKEILKLLKN